jgi:hypothetical protein
VQLPFLLRLPSQAGREGRHTYTNSSEPSTLLAEVMLK